MRLLDGTYPEVGGVVVVVTVDAVGGAQSGAGIVDGRAAEVELVAELELLEAELVRELSDSGGVSAYNLGLTPNGRGQGEGGRWGEGGGLEGL